MSTTEIKKDEKKINLRELSDVDCSNVVVSRQIRRMARKFPSMCELTMDCWSHGGHYVKFLLTDNDVMKWECCKDGPVTDGCQTLFATNEDLTSDELNKLLVYTYRTMCDNKDGVDIIDTPEDLLAFAETKLQEMLKDEEALATV